MMWSIWRRRTTRQVREVKEKEMERRKERKRAARRQVLQDAATRVGAFLNAPVAWRKIFIRVPQERKQRAPSNHPT